MVALDRVRVDEPGCARVLVDGHPGLAEILVRQRVGTDLAGDLADAIEQPRIVERGFTGGDAVARELPGLPDQPRRMGQRTDRDGSVGRGHAAERIPRDERGPGSESRGA